MKNPLPTRPNLFKIIQDNYDNKRKQIRSGGNPSSLKSKVNMSLPPMETRSGSINPYLYSIHPESNVQGFGFGVQGNQEIGRFNLSGGVESNYMPNQGMANPMFNAGVGYRFYDGGYISDRAKATQFGQYDEGGTTGDPNQPYHPITNPGGYRQKNTLEKVKKLPNKEKRYEPTNAVKNLKTTLAGASIASSGNPLTQYLAQVAGGTGDLYTAARYAADGQYKKAGEDVLQGVLGFIPYAKAASGLKGDYFTKGAKLFNDWLKRGHTASDIKTFSESPTPNYPIHKMGGGYFPPYHSYTPPRMEDGGPGPISFFPQQDPEMMYTDRFNTSLNEEETEQFNKWVAKESKRQGRDIMMDKGAYDVQGFWKSGDYKNRDKDGHGTDTWKKPNHPTFSNQSKYHGVDGFYGGNWTSEDGYQPSKQSANMYGPSYYNRMFAEEPGRPEHLDASRYMSGANAPSPLFYKNGGGPGDEYIETNFPIPYSNEFINDYQQDYNNFYAPPRYYGKDDGIDAYYRTKRNRAPFNTVIQNELGPTWEYKGETKQTNNFPDVWQRRIDKGKATKEDFKYYPNYIQDKEIGNYQLKRLVGHLDKESRKTPSSLFFNNGGDISIPNLNTDDMNIMDYMRNGGIYAYADGGDTKASIVDYLNAQGMSSDKTSRKKLAESMGIKGYTGSYDQNVEMVTRLNNSRYNPSQQAAQNPYIIARPETAPAQSGFGSMPRMSQPAAPAPRQAAPAPRTSKKPAAQQAPAQQQVVGQDSGFRPYSPEQLNQMYNFPGTLNFKKPATTAKQAATRKTKQANAEDQRNLESGMVTDKGTNMTHIIKNGKIVKSFPVLTGQARDVNYSPYTVAQLAKNPSLRGTPVGTYFSKPDANLYGEAGFRMNPIPAFGQQAPAAQPGLAQHITFGKTEDPAEYRRREALYNQSPAARATSYGCTNCRKPDLDYMVNAFPQGDTTMVIDSRTAADANLLKNKFKKKAHGGENDDYSGTYSAGVYYGQGGSFIPEFYSPEYGLPEMMYGTEYDNNYSYANGGLVKGGEYDMSEQEIQNLIDQGYKIQYI